MGATRRRSRKRDAILECIRGTATHPSAEWIYEQLKPQFSDLSLGTVYRNLTLFRQEGTIVAVTSYNGTERLDACTEPHAHFLCESCGSLTDVDIPYDDLSAALETQAGLEVRRCELLFRGLCAECRRKKNIRT